MFGFNPAPKPSHGRRTPKRKNRGEFSTKVRKEIVTRDKGLCVRCGGRYEHIHHVVFRSQGGEGTTDNGVCVCNRCHDWAHMSREGRLWFEKYRKLHLIKGGKTDGQTR